MVPPSRKTALFIHLIARAGNLGSPWTLPLTCNCSRSRTSLPSLPACPRPSPVPAPAASSPAAGWAAKPPDRPHGSGPLLACPTVFQWHVCCAPSSCQHLPPAGAPPYPLSGQRTLLTHTGEALSRARGACRHRAHRFHQRQRPKRQSSISHVSLFLIDPESDKCAPASLTTKSGQVPFTRPCLRESFFG